MAIGDIGGAVTELVITCRTPANGHVNIKKGDAVMLTGPYTVDNATDAGDVVFGQALANAAEKGAVMPVRVRGIAIFEYTGPAPTVDGQTGIWASAMGGKVKAPACGNGVGRNVKVDEYARKVHVLL